MVNLENYNKLIVSQKVEGIQALTGIETKNKYKILTEENKEILYAYEKSNFLARIFLNRLRSLKIYFIDENKNKYMAIEKKFAFYLPKFKIFEENNNLIAYVETKFAFNSILKVYDNQNNLIFTIKNKILHPWKFKVYYKDYNDENNVVAEIDKKWRGTLKELFTTADNFLVDFKNIENINAKKIILASSIVIDLFVFEYQNNKL